MELNTCYLQENLFLLDMDIMLTRVVYIMRFLQIGIILIKILIGVLMVMTNMVKKNYSVLFVLILMRTFMSGEYSQERKKRFKTIPINFLHMS